MRSLVCRSPVAGLIGSAALFAFTAFAAEPANLSPAAKEIVRMTEAGVDPAAVEAYVGTLRARMPLQADDIIYLHQHQVPGAVITAMIKHEPAQEQIASAPVQQVQQYQSAPAPVQPAPAAPAYVAAPPVVYTPPPVYYSYPDYCYPGWYGWAGPAVGFRFSFGGFPHFGFGFSHHFGGHWHR